MKTLIQLFAVIVAVSAFTIAQTAGDYRTAASGDWNAAGTWELFDGTSWIAASGKPTSDSGAIEIRSGHVVTVTANDSADQITISSGGNLVVNTGITFVVKDGAGDDLVVADSLVNFGTISKDGGATIVFNAGGVYRHALNGGSIPVATWNEGSTILLTGIVGNAPANGNQNFYNVVWNNPGQTANLNLGWNGNTIGGDISIISTGPGRWQLCAPTVGNSATTTIKGNITMLSGQFTSHGTSNNNTTVTVHLLGNIHVSGGNFSLTRGSQGGTGTTVWYVGGDSMVVDGASTITMQNSNFTLNNTKIYFSKKGSQVVKLNNVSISSYNGTSSGAGFPFEVLDSSVTKFILSNITYGGAGISFIGQVDSGATLDMDTSTIAGTGRFTLKDYATLISGKASGVNGNIATPDSVLSLSKLANYTFAGTTAQVPGSRMPDSVNVLTISNPAGVTLADTFRVKDLQVSAGALLRVDTLAILAADTGRIDGTLWNKDSLSSGHGFVFGNGSVYEHARNGGHIPKGVWEAGSLCKITGFTSASSLAGGGDQDFYNLEWNSPNQTSNASLGLYTKAIHGDVILTSSGSGRFYFMGGSSGTITLYGNFIQTAGNFGINGTGSQTFDTVNCYGNVTVTGGNWSVTRGSQSGGTGTSIWNMYGKEFSLINATTQNSNSGAGGGGAKVVFAKQDTQKLILNNVTYAGGGLPLQVASGSTLDLDTSIIQGTGPLTVDSGATLLLRKEEGVNGHIATTGTVTLSTGANYSFNGSAAQVTGLLMPDVVNNLTIHNASGVTLSKATTINGVLALKAGVFNNTIPFTLGAGGSISYEGGSLLLPAVINVVSIAEARKDANSDLIPDHLNDTVKVYGVITSPNYQTTNTSYYIQDDSAGINVFASGTVMNFEIGDSIFVIGKILQFNGLTEISPLAANATFINVLKQNAVIPAPKQLTLAQFLANPEMYESQLIRIDTLYKSSGNWPAAGSSASIYLKKMGGTDSLQLRIDSDTDIDGSLEPQYPVNVVGIASQFSSGATVYNNGYQILPRDTADIQHVIVVGVAEELANVPVEYKLYQNYPNPFNPITTIKFTVAKAGMAKVKIYNTIGQEVATIFNQLAEPGKYYTVQLNASHLSSGMYFSVFESENHREIKKMILLK